MRPLALCLLLLLAYVLALASNFWPILGPLAIVAMSAWVGCMIEVDHPQDATSGDEETRK